MIVSELLQIDQATPSIMPLIGYDPQCLNQASKNTFYKLVSNK